MKYKYLHVTFYAKLRHTICFWVAPGGEGGGQQSASQYLEAVHELDDPGVVGLGHDVTLRLDVRHLVLQDHVVLQHALHRVHLLGRAGDR